MSAETKIADLPLESVLLYADEASLSNTASLSYQWSPKGKQPLIQQIQRKKERFTLFGAFQPQTGKVITHIALRERPELSLPFLCKLCKAFPKQKIYLVLDSVRYHHTNRFKPILQRFQHRIEFIFLPPT